MPQECDPAGWWYCCQWKWQQTRSRQDDCAFIYLGLCDKCSLVLHSDITPFDGVSNGSYRSTLVWGSFVDAMCWIHTPIEYLEQHGARACVYTARLFGNVCLLLVALPPVWCLRSSPLSSAVPARSSNMVHLCWASKLSISCQHPCYVCYIQKVQWRYGNKTARTNTKLLKRESVWLGQGL